jgi:hypothetical protein
MTVDGGEGGENCDAGDDGQASFDGVYDCFD